MLPISQLPSPTGANKGDFVIEYVSVSSHSIEMVGFDAETATLGVCFRSGAEYHYYNVPSELFEGLRSANSPGNYLDTYIKKAGYTYARVR
jgi:hypothetical protein